jgi:multidrug efflux pump subunit AcrA (membrane-fusion protein)
MTLRVPLLLFAIAAAACGSAEAKHTTVEPSPVVVSIATAHAEPLDVIYRASGTVRGKSTASLTSKTTGYVREVKVRPGDRIARGQLLAVLEANDTAASVRRATAGLDFAAQSKAEAEHTLEAARVAAKNAKTTRDRIAALAKEGSVAQAQLDDADAQWSGAAAQEQAAEARLRSAASRIAQAGAEVGEAQAMLDYAKIVAPFDGRVIERRVDPGNLASPGTTLLVVEEDARLRVEASVVESRASAIAVGDDATVLADASPEPLRAKISEVVPAVDAASRSFLVKLDLPEGVAPALRPGMFARVLFRVGARDRLVVPRAAIHPLGALDRVLVVDGGRARLRMITLGEAQGDWIEVLSGLDAGELVVIAPAAVRDGARVEVKP